MNKAQLNSWLERSIDVTDEFNPENNGTYRILANQRVIMEALRLILKETGRQ